MAKTKTIWISPEILGWIPVHESHTCYSEDKKKRAYEIWSHAEHILSKTTNEFERVDAITTLKRSINHRLRNISLLYKFDKLKLPNTPRHLLQQLEFFGLVRPMMLRKLMDIRNAVEHKDSKAPSQNRCLELLEFTWYFLKSTDSLCTRVVDSIILHHPEEYHKNDCYCIDSSRDQNWKFSILGWIPPQIITEKESKGWLIARLQKKHTRQFVLDKIDKDDSDEVEESRKDCGKNPDDIFFTCTLHDTSPLRDKLALLYFMVT